DGWNNQVDYYVGGADKIQEIREGLIAEFDGAKDRIDGAISELDDSDIQKALMDAADRGVKVRLVADEHYEGTPGFDELLTHDDMEIVFGDGELNYLPEPTVSSPLEYCWAEAHEDYSGPCTNARHHVTCPRSRSHIGTTPRNTDNMMHRAS